MADENGVPTSSSSRHPRQGATQREFYDRPYITCKDCMASKFKCKQCLQQLVEKLRLYRKQHDAAVEEQRREVAQYYHTKGLIGKADKLPAQSHKLIVPQELLHDRVVKLSSLRNVAPVVHHTIIELPDRSSKQAVRQSQISPVLAMKMERWKYQNSQQLLNCSDRADESEERTINNRLSVHTIEAPSVDREPPPKHEPRHKNRPKPAVNSQRQKKNGSQEAFLPCIRQLNIQERQLVKRPVVAPPPPAETLRYNESKRTSMQLINRQRNSNRATPSSLHALLPVSAWEQHDRQHDINY